MKTTVWSRSMFTIMIVCSMGWISGCSTAEKPPEIKHQDMVVDKFVQPLSRNEVIYAVRECETNGLRAVMLYGKRKINGYTTEIVIDVTCSPKM